MGSQDRPADRVAVLRGSQQPHDNLEWPETRHEKGKKKREKRRDKVGVSALIAWATLSAILVANRVGGCVFAAPLRSYSPLKRCAASCVIAVLM